MRLRGPQRRNRNRRLICQTFPEPGDVLRAIQQQKEQRDTQGNYRGVTSAPPPRPTVTAAAAGAAKPTVSAAAATPAVAAPAGNRSVSAGTPVSAAPAAPVAAGTPAGSKPAPRKIVPLPRQAPQIVTSTPTPTPAIASRAPQGPVIVKPPSSGLTGASTVVAVPARSAPQEARQATPAAVQCCSGSDENSAGSSTGGC